MFIILIISRLNADEQIQMVTALILQLIQSVVKLPDTTEPEVEDLEETNKKDQVLCFRGIKQLFPN